MANVKGVAKSKAAERGETSGWHRWQCGGGEAWRPSIITRKRHGAPSLASSYRALTTRAVTSISLRLLLYGSALNAFYMARAGIRASAPLRR